MQAPRPAAHGRSNSRAPTMVMIRREAGGTDFGNILADTTLLVLGAEADHLRDYRIWAEELGGIALQIGSEYALADWLDRNIFVRAAVLIDDASFDPRDSMRIAAEIRLLRPDVAVTLLHAPRVAASAPSTPSRPAPSRPALRPPRDAPGYAIFNRPLGRSGFARAMASALRHVIVDHDSRTHLGGKPKLVPTPTDVFYDDTGPRSGHWVGPLVVLGAALWLAIGVVTLKGG